MDLVIFLFEATFNPSIVDYDKAQWATAAFLSCGIFAGALGFLCMVIKELFEA